MTVAHPERLLDDFQAAALRHGRLGHPQDEHRVSGSGAWINSVQGITFDDMQPQVAKSRGRCLKCMTKWVIMLDSLCVGAFCAPPESSSHPSRVREYATAASHGHRRASRGPGVGGDCAAALTIPPQTTSRAPRASTAAMAALQLARAATKLQARRREGRGRQPVASDHLHVVLGLAAEGHHGCVRQEREPAQPRWCEAHRRSLVPPISLATEQSRPSVSQARRSCRSKASPGKSRDRTSGRCGGRGPGPWPSRRGCRAPSSTRSASGSAAGS